MAARKGAKKVVEKVIHPPFLKLYIPAAKAAPAPPLGPQLGQVNLFYKSCEYETRLIRKIRPF